MLKLKKIKVSKTNGNEPISLDEEALAFPPSFSANAKQIPEIEDWEVGEKYQIVLEVQMKSMSSYDNGTKKTVNANFDVLAYSVPDDYENMSDEDLEEMQAKGLSS